LALIFALVAVLIWIFVSIFATQGASGISPEMRKLAKPLTPTLNKNLLDKIGQKRHLTKQDLERFPIFALIEVDGGGYAVVDVVNDQVIGLSGVSEADIEKASVEENGQPESEVSVGQTATTSAELTSEIEPTGASEPKAEIDITEQETIPE
jgi:hypothetical protein